MTLMALNFIQLERNDKENLNVYAEKEFF
jgi:hypothetical protein